MVSSGQPRSIFRFGTFEVDLRARELYKQGLKIRLQQQPFQVLALLLQHAGEAVTREELKQAIWPAETFVDFDVGLDATIYKLRQALGDTAENPRYIETLPRRGYRFLAPVAGDQTQPPPLDDHRPAAASATTSKLVAIDARTLVEELPGKLAEVIHQSAGSAPRSATFWLRRAAIVAGLVALVAVTWWFAHPKPSSNIIAVLPFKNLSSEPNSDYFSDGLTDEIIHNLSLIEGLEVKCRTSSFEFKDKQRNIRKVGEELGANFVLEGSVLRSGDKLRINAQLVRVADDTPLWSGRFDRELRDIFAVQDEISRGIVNQLRLKLGAGQRRYNANLEAYELYLKAEQSLGQAGVGGKEIPKAIGLYEEVLAKDGDFAPAYAGLAAAYARLSATDVFMPAKEADAKMRSAAEAALRLDPLLPQAHNLMGMVYVRERAWGEAEQSFRRAIQLNPNLSLARIQFAMWVLFPLGKQEEALAQTRRAVELDPLSEFITVDAAYVMNSTGRNDDALALSRRLLTTYPDNGFLKMQMARALTQRGQVEEAIKIFEKLASPYTNHYLGYAYAKAGRRAEAEALAARNQEHPHRLAIIYAGLGDKDRTFDALNRMDEDKNPLLESYISFPELAAIRGDPRLAELRRRLGLPAIP